MSVFLLPQQFTRQPRYPAKIDRSNPLTRSVTMLLGVAGGNIYEATGPSPTVGEAVTATPSFSVGPNGQYLKLENSNSGSAKGWRIADDSKFRNVGLTNQWTVFAYITPRQRVSSDFLFGFNAAARSASTDYNGGLYWALAGAFMYVVNGSNVSVSSGAAPITVDRPTMIVGTYDGAAITCYTDGVASTTGAQTGNVRQTDWYISLNAWNSSGCLAYDFHFGGMATRCFSQSEINSLSKEPWQLFQAPRRVFAVGATAAPGSFLPAWARASTSVIGSGIHA